MRITMALYKKGMELTNIILNSSAFKRNELFHGLFKHTRTLSTSTIMAQTGRQRRTDYAHPKDTRYSAENSVSDLAATSKQLLTPEYPLAEDDSVQASTFKGLKTDFPCLHKTKHEGPEPEYSNIVSGYEVYHHEKPFGLRISNGLLPGLDIAYETWGVLNEKKDNAVLLCTGMSASSHAKSHKKNENPGWWEKFIGPGSVLDTNKYFIVCSNNLGGCYGTSGPMATNPNTGKAYGTTFPLVTVEDMVRAQFVLLDHLGIDKLYACVGSSLGGMQSLTAGVLYPHRVTRLVCISGCTRTHPSTIALRYLQRKAIMMDPAWHKGHYYDIPGAYPKFGMKLAREIATITYRSGPEWDLRFGRRRIDDSAEPTLCPYFDIENYIEYQGEQFSMRYDPNSIIYISKAMDLFDLSETFGTMYTALRRVTCPVMVMGVKTDMLFPVWQQREMAQQLQDAGNNAVSYYELNSIYGHDTFLLDLNGVGAGVKGFLDTYLPDVDKSSC